MISQPTIVDTTFREFASETDFLLELETLLQDVWSRDEGSIREEENLSIVSLDVDDQSSIALKYANRAARSISQHMGERIRGQMQLSDRYASGKFFHISADRYFLLHQLSLEEAQKLAITLKEALQVTYRIKPISAGPSIPIAQENMLEIKATLHFGVTCYSYRHLKTLLRRFPADVAVQSVKMRLIAGIEEQLALGKMRGGNCIFTWNKEQWKHTPL